MAMTEEQVRDSGAPAPAAGGHPLFDSPIYRTLTSLEVFGQRHVLHPEELVNRATGDVGIGLLQQAPSVSSDSIAGLEVMLRRVPSPQRRSPGRISPGHPMPDFDLTGSHGTRIRKHDMQGRPFAVRLTRTMGSGII
jgi:hypothetical protein